jgi:hypothetical protein
MASHHVGYRNSDSDPPGPGGYCGEGCEGFRRGRGSGPIEQMVVDEDTVEAVFLTELCSFDDLSEGFVGCLEDPASEPGLILHPLIHESTLMKH